MDCEHCGKKITELPKSCTYCGHFFCTNCRLPEAHDCDGLRTIFKERKKAFKKNMAGFASTHMLVNDRGAEVVVDRELNSKHVRGKIKKKLEKTPKIYKKPKESVSPQENEDLRIKSKMDISRIAVPVIIGIFLLCFLLLSLTPKQYITKENTIYVNRTVSSIIPVNTSFSEYMLLTDKGYAEPVSLIGRLLEESIPVTPTISSIRKYVVDDYGNKIKIYIISSTISKDYNTFFIKSNITTKYYNITGVLRTRRFGSTELNIEVKSLTPVKRPETSYFKVVKDKQLSAINETVRSIINISYGFERVKIILFGCGTEERRYDLSCIPIVKCSDGTLEPECSTNQPYQCINKQLISNSDKCGCPYDYKKDGIGCKKIQRCSDNTIYDECSGTKPLYCKDGQLVRKSSICGCSGEDISDGDICVSKYMTDPKETRLNYVLRGTSLQITYKVYGGMNSYLSGLERSMSYTSGTVPPSDIDFVMRNLNNEKQKQFIQPLVDEIKRATSNRDDQARIAISLVQNIPYDDAGLLLGTIIGKYPYEVLYTNAGVCSEKSQLLAYILRDLGYGVVIFRFDIENHDAVGIKCPQEYSYINSGYCFVESTTPSIITDSNGDYEGVGKLTSTLQMLTISDGILFESVFEEYEDNQEFQNILSMGAILPPMYYGRWLEISNKYGMKTQ